MPPDRLFYGRFTAVTYLNISVEIPKSVTRHEKESMLKGDARAGQIGHQIDTHHHKHDGISENKSPKGNMWSVISVALPRLIVNLSEGKQGSSPEEDEVL